MSDEKIAVQKDFDLSELNNADLGMLAYQIEIEIAKRDIDNFELSLLNKIKVLIETRKLV